MDLNKLVSIGETTTREYIVKMEDTAHSLGNIGVTVLSTPVMITHMEETASSIVFHKLPKNYSLVGTKINISHIKPTFVDMKVIVKATLKAIDGMKLTYYVEAHNIDGMIGFGDYEQHVINLNEFLKKIEDKK